MAITIYPENIASPFSRKREKGLGVEGFLFLLFFIITIILFSGCASHVRFTRSPEPVRESRPVPAKRTADTAAVPAPLPAGEEPGMGKGLPAPQGEPVAPAGIRSGRPFQEGEASYYAHQFHGRKTANGEVFDMNAYTAAHPTLPFHTKVRVLNTENDKSVIVRINDRGPFKKDRIIDLSMASARAIDLVKKGCGTVQLFIVETNP